jgi:hypothetical protein
MKLTVKGKKVRPSIDKTGQYLVLDNVKANQKIEIKYPATETITKRTLAHRPITMKWVGNYVTELSPKGSDFPVFPGKSYYEFYDGKEYGHGFLSATAKKSDGKVKQKFGTDGLPIQVKDEEGSFDTVKWVRLDLGKSVKIDEVVVYPADPINLNPRQPGYCFPKRFIVEASDSPWFEEGNVTVIADHTKENHPAPGTNPVTLKVQKEIKARFIRFKATRLTEKQDRPGSREYTLALAEIAVISGNKNIAKHAQVYPSDYQHAPNSGWEWWLITDGYVNGNKL